MVSGETVYGAGGADAWCVDDVESVRVCHVWWLVCPVGSALRSGRSRAEGRWGFGLGVWVLVALGVWDHPGQIRVPAHIA